jgi:hypothetical protein
MAGFIFIVVVLVLLACESMDAATGLILFGGVISFVIGAYVAPGLDSAIAIGILGAIATGVGLAWFLKPRRHRHRP